MGNSVVVVFREGSACKFLKFKGCLSSLHGRCGNPQPEGKRGPALSRPAEVILWAFFHGGLLFLPLLFHHFPVLFGIQLPSPFNISHD